MKKNPFFTNLDELRKGLSKEEPEMAVFNFNAPDNFAEKDDSWFGEDYEGQLAVDVYQTKDNIVVKSTIAGVAPKDLEIFLHNDLLTIRGKRQAENEESGAEYFYKECFFGGFSRSIILPMDVQADKVQASFKNGLLTIILPKAQKSKMINVQFEE